MVFGSRRQSFRTWLERAGVRYPAVATETHGFAIGGVVPFEPDEMSTWKLGDLAAEKIEALSCSDEPFFLKVSFRAPHVPWRVPQDYMVDSSTVDLDLPTKEELDRKPRFELKNLRIYSGSLSSSR